MKGFSVHEAEVDIFLEFSSFFSDPTNVCNLISGSSAFSKSSLNIWKFLVHILLKPSLRVKKKNVTGVWLVYSVMLFSAVQQSESAVCMYTYIFSFLDFFTI